MKKNAVRYKIKELFKELDILTRIWDNPELLRYNEDDIFRILKGFNEYVGTQIAETRDGVSLPLHMGVMFGGIYGKNPYMPDVVTSKQVKKKINFKNYHSDGYAGKIFYVTHVTKKRFAVGKFWGFEACKSIKSICAKGFRENWKKYVNVPNSREAWRLFDEVRLKQYAKDRGVKAFELYDEFDFNNTD